MALGASGPSSPGPDLCVMRPGLIGSGPRPASPPPGTRACPAQASPSHRLPAGGLHTSPIWKALSATKRWQPRPPRVHPVPGAQLVARPPDGSSAAPEPHSAPPPCTGGRRRPQTFLGPPRWRGPGLGLRGAFSASDCPSASCHRGPFGSSVQAPRAVPRPPPPSMNWAAVPAPPHRTFHRSPGARGSRVGSHGSPQGRGARWGRVSPQSVFHGGCRELTSSDARDRTGNLGLSGS